MNNSLGRTTPARTRSARGRPAPEHETAPVPFSPSPKALPKDSSTAVQPSMLYPLPSIQATNMLDFRCSGSIEGTWAIDAGMKIPKSALARTVGSKGRTEARANVQLTSDDGGDVTATLYIVPCTSLLSSLGFGMKAITIKVNGTFNGNIEVTILDTQRQATGPARKNRAHRPPVHIYCRTDFGGNVSVALPRSFHGSILLGRRAEDLSDIGRQTVCEYSAGVKERLCITAANDEEHRGFIGLPGKGAKDNLKVDCRGRIHICYEYEKVGVPDIESIQCLNQ